jgi:site-specific recombinase XerD
MDPLAAPPSFRRSTPASHAPTTSSPTPSAAPKDRLSPLQTQFLAERRFLKNVTEKTLIWYETAFQSYQKTQPSTALPTKASLQAWVIALRQRGVRAVSVNTWLKALNAFCVWLHQEGHVPAPIVIKPLRAEKPVIATLTEAQVRTLLAVRPRGFRQWRRYAVICLLLDTGLRIDEALSVTTEDLDFDNLLLTVRNGKGRKDRIVPVSVETRKVLWSYARVRANTTGACGSPLWFPSGNGGRWRQRNSLRSLYNLQQQLGLPQFGWHRLRHTFATSWVRAGGDVVRLSRVLGHASLQMTMRYQHLDTADLQVAHQHLSLINRLRRSGAAPDPQSRVGAVRPPSPVSSAAPRRASGRSAAAPRSA